MPYQGSTLGKLLILTDHSTHSNSNSFYTVAESFASSKAFTEVHLCSRGVEENLSFFTSEEDFNCFVTRLPIFPTYEAMQGIWREDLFENSILDYSVILLRVPRPIAPAFFSKMSQLSDLQTVINDPKGIALTGSKRFLLELSDLCPPLRWVNHPDEALNYAKEYPIVLKPAEDYGGKGVLKIEGTDIWLGNQKLSFDQWTNYFPKEGMLAMKFLTNVTQGDKRIIVADGEIIVSTLRFPAEGSWLCNIAQGGKSKEAEADKDEIDIVSKINPILRKHGVLLYGLDTLVDDQGKRVLSEINTLSIGGIGPAEITYKKPYAAMIVERIIHYLRHKR